jgi:hypothetical protein
MADNHCNSPSGDSAANPKPKRPIDGRVVRIRGGYRLDVVSPELLDWLDARGFSMNPMSWTGRSLFLHWAIADDLIEDAEDRFRLLREVER